MKIMQKTFATTLLAISLIAVMMIGMQIEPVDAKKAKGTSQQQYGSATKHIVCGDRLCSEVGQDVSLNVSGDAKHLEQSTHDDSMKDYGDKKHDDAMKGYGEKKHGSSSESITGAILKSNNFDRTSGTVTVVIDAYEDGKIKIDIPQINNVDMVIVDGEEWDDAYVYDDIVKVYFYAGTEKIEIIGN